MAGPEPTFTRAVTRAEDLLVVTFEFVNLTSRQDGMPFLIRVQPGVPRSSSPYCRPST
jgi:hypothetical protein